MYLQWVIQVLPTYLPTDNQERFHPHSPLGKIHFEPVYICPSAQMVSPKC